MSFYNRRNAAVGYLTLKAVQRAIENKRRKRRSGMKVAAYVGLGLVSAGILAAVLAIALKRRQGEAEEIAVLETDAEIVGEYVTAPEPVPAT
jgi:DMSO reductase anchor subunit